MKTVSIIFLCVLLLASSNSLNATSGISALEPTRMTEIVDQVEDDGTTNQIATSESIETIPDREDAHLIGEYDRECVSNPQIKRASITSPIIAEDDQPIEIYGPDYISFNEGEFGWTIDWEIYGAAPGYYWVYQNGEVLFGGDWDYSGYLVSVNLDGLPAGNYAFDLDVGDSIGSQGWFTTFVDVWGESQGIEIYGPDYISFNEGELGWTIDWEIYGTATGYYWVYQNGELLLEGVWDYSGYIVTVNLDGVPLGNYIFQIFVEDSNYASGGFDTFVDILSPFPMIIGPEEPIFLMYGDTGYSIIWEIFELNPLHYEVIRTQWGLSSETIIWETWWENTTVVVSLDELSPGQYMFSIEAVGLYNSAFSSVDVYVDAIIPPPTIQGPESHSFTEGETGNQLMYQLYDVCPLEYVVWVGHNLLIREMWLEPELTITVDLDYLGVGEYFVRIVALNEFFLQAEWYTLVTVYPQPEYIIHDPIWIESDSDFQYYADLEGWSGDGSEMSPFIIENYAFISPEICFYIGYTSYHYVIRNCIFSSSASSYYTTGLIIESAPEGIIEDCRFYTTGSLQIYYADGFVIWNNEFHGERSEYTVTIGYSTDILVEENQFYDSYGSLYIMGSYQLNIVNNTFSNCWLGIMLMESFDCVVVGNTFDSGGILIDGYWTGGYWHNTFLDNFMNGRPMGFFFDLDGISVDVREYSQLFIYNCTNSEFYNGVFEKSAYLVTLAFSQSCTISDLIFTEGSMFIDRSHDCIVQNIACLDRSSFYVRQSQNLVFSDCIVTNTIIAYQLYETDSILVTENTISYCDTGIQPHHCAFTMITNSSFIANVIAIDDVYNIDTTVYNSIFVNNTKYAISVIQSENCIICHNTFDDNYYSIFITYSMNCYIFDNQFFSSLKMHAYDYGPIPQNYWDDGISIGNSWDDYCGIGWYYVLGHGLGIDHYPSATTVPTPPSTNSPDNITIQEGDDSQVVSWSVDDDNREHYEIWLDSELIAYRDWLIGDDTINFELIDLIPGVYTYTLILFDMDGLSTTDVVIVTVLADTTPPSIDYYWGTTYYYGDINNYVVWGIYDDNPLYYEIYIDGVYSETYLWNEAFMEVVISVDGLTVGVYQFELIAYGIGGSTSAWVDVIVLPNTVPIVSSPADVSYYFGSTNNQITWDATDPYLAYYEVTLNGSYYDWGLFTLMSESVTINIDGLDIGVYEFTIVVSNYGANTTDTVIVTVMKSEIPDHVTSYFTNNGDKAISTFDVIFKKSIDGYKLVQIHPHRIAFNIEFVNIWPYDLGTLVFSINIPSDFYLREDNPIRIYADGIDVTDSALISGTEITLYNIASGSNVTIRIMVDYALLGIVFESIDDFGLHGYWFDVATTESGPTTVTSDYSRSSLISKQNKVTMIAGFVLDINGIPMIGMIVELYDSEGYLIANTSTDVDGFYYFIDIERGVYVVIVRYNQMEYESEAVVKNNKITLVDFIILEEYE